MNDQTSPIDNNTPTSSTYRSDNQGRPTGTPAGGKDFRKIYERDARKQNSNDDDVALEVDEEGDNDNAIAMAGMSAIMKKKAAQAASPFSLFNTPPKNGDEAEIAMGDQNAPIESPSDVFSSMGKTQVVQPNAKAQPKEPKQVSEKVVKFSSDMSSAEGIALEDISDAKKAQAKSKFNSQFDREQPDLSYVNPLGTPSVQISVNNQTDIKVERPAETTPLHELITQLIDKMQTLVDSGKNETTVTLKQPPQFDGVRIVITNYDTAQNQFNIKFENLTQSAQLLISQQHNREVLQSNLEKKGYNVQLFVATTFDESKPLVLQAEGEQRNDDRGREREEQQRQKQKEGRQG